MRYVYYSGVDVLPDQLWDFAWSAPMRDLAERVGMSDVGLRKALRSYGVILPPQGHWNRVHAGRKVETRPKVPERRPGETGRIRLDTRLAKLFDPANPMPVEGPFASTHVPDDLDELRAKELRAIGRVRVPKNLDLPNRGLFEVMCAEDRRRAKNAEKGYLWDAPKFDGTLWRRRLRILSAVFDALDKRGYSATAHERDGELHTGVKVGDIFLPLRIEIAGRHRTVRQSGRTVPSPDLPANTPLRFSVRGNLTQSEIESWADDAEGILETKVAAIAAGVIVAGELRFRQGLKEEVENKARQRREEEERRKERLAALNTQRLVDLRASGELLRQAQDIRTLVSEVKQAMQDGELLRSEQALAAWERWALAEADRIDPIKSGQIEKHLDEPKRVE